MLPRPLALFVSAIAGENVGGGCYIDNIFTSTVTGNTVFVNSNGRLGP